MPNCLPGKGLKFRETARSENTKHNSSADFVKILMLPAGCPGDKDWIVWLKV